LGDTGPNSLELPARFNSDIDLANVNVPDFDFLRIPGFGSGDPDLSESNSIPSPVMRDDRGDDVAVAGISISTRKLRDFLNSPRLSGGPPLFPSEASGDAIVDSLDDFSCKELSLASATIFEDLSIKACFIPSDDGIVSAFCCIAILAKDSRNRNEL
jgi:hypothetical protein